MLNLWNLGPCPDSGGKVNPQCAFFVYQVDFGLQKSLYTIGISMKF